MVSLNVLGLNCGTSVDAIDVALCRIDSIATATSSNDVRIEMLSFTEVPVTPALRTQILSLCRPNAATTLAEVCDLNFALGREFSRAIKDSGVDLAHVDLIASHGQTLWHNPDGGESASTLQMAEPAVIAQQTNKTVVSNFRVAELAVGRQGAPLSGFFEACLLASPSVTRISQNIGGIGNASVLPALQGPGPQKLGSTYMAFDTGPGNVFIDAAVRILSNGELHYDKDGEAGARGEAEIDHDFIERYLGTEPYFQRQPPKTTGRELFSDDVARRLVLELQQREHKNGGTLSADGIIATVTRITAESIARAYEQFVLPLLGPGGTIDEIYICGGGAFNPNILDHLRRRFPQAKVLKLDDSQAGLAAAAKEAVLFALLGYLCVHGRSVPIAGYSESMDPAVLGVITPGHNYRDLMHRITTHPSFDTSSGVLGRILM